MWEMVSWRLWEVRWRGKRTAGVVRAGDVMWEGGGKGR